MAIYWINNIVLDTNIKKACSEIQTYLYRDGIQYTTSLEDFLKACNRLNLILNKKPLKKQLLEIIKEND